MRYQYARKYPITQMKKDDRQKSQEKVVDLSLSTAAVLLTLAFAKGLLWGYMFRRRRIR